MIFSPARLFTSSRKGADDIENEDGVLAAETPWGTVLAVIDGMTQQTEWRVSLPQGAVTSGWLAKEAVLSEAQALAPDNAAEFLPRVFARWQELRAIHDIPPSEIIGAAFAVYIPWLNEVHRLADCAYGFEAEGAWQPAFEGFADAGPLVRLRAEVIQRLAVSCDRHDTKARRDLAWQGWEALQQARRIRHFQQGSWVSDIDRVQREFQRIPVPPDTRRIVLCTDGFPAVPRSLEEALALLEDIRREDPLTAGFMTRGGKPALSAKGFIDPGRDDVLPYLDDVAFIEAVKSS